MWRVDPETITAEWLLADRRAPPAGATRQTEQDLERLRRAIAFVGHGRSLVELADRGLPGMKRLRGLNLTEVTAAASRQAECLAWALAAARNASFGERPQGEESRKHFIVVNWDQRGAGKSYQAIDPISHMTVDQFVSDATQLTNYLRNRFHRIYVVGASWGTHSGHCSSNGIRSCLPTISAPARWSRRAPQTRSRGATRLRVDVATVMRAGKCAVSSWSEADRAAHTYHHRSHSGLNYRAPREVAATWQDRQDDLTLRA